MSRLSKEAQAQLKAAEENHNEVRIVFEGPRASGKTLLITIIQRALTEAGVHFKEADLAGFEHTIVVNTTDKAALAKMGWMK